MKKTIMLATMMIILVLAVTSVNAVNPSIKVSVSNYDPLPAVPGRNVDVWINVQNVGSDAANDLEIEFVDSSAFKLISLEDRVTNIPVLGIQKDNVIKYTLEVVRDAPEGSSEILLKYIMGNLPGQSFENKLFIDVKSTQALITISKVGLNPESIIPGSKSELSIFIKNLAKSTGLRDVTVSLGLTPVVSATAILIDYPFVPIGSANQKTIGRILPGQTSEVIFELAAYPDAESGIYKLPVSLSYYDDAGVNYNKSVLIGVEVNTKPDILVVIESSEINTKVSQGEVNFEITNKGLSDVKLMTVTLEESDDYEILSASNELYIGNIDSDDFETARFTVKTAAGVKTIVFRLKIDYKDSLNSRFVEDVELSYKIREPQNGNGSPVGTVVVVVIILAIAAFIYFKKKQKKRRKG